MNGRYAVSDHRRAVDAEVAARRRLALALAGVIAVVVGLYLAAVIAGGDGVPNGTTVRGIDISGQSVDEAATTLDRALAKKVKQPIRVSAGEQTFVIKPADAGLAFDAQATAAQAAGRVWNPITLITNLTATRQLEPVITVDDAAMNAQLDTIAASVDTPPQNPVLEIQKTNVKLTKGVDGATVNRDGTRDVIIDAFMNVKKPVPAVIDVVSPEVSSDTANASVEFAKTAIANPIDVQANEITATIPTDVLASALSFNAEGDQLVPEMDGTILHAAIAPELAPIEDPGRNATFKIVKGKPVVVPSKVGEGVSDEELSQAVLSVAGNGPDDRSVTVSVGVRDPELTTEAANALGVTEKLSSFTQNFPYAAYRVQNIGQAARYIDGTVLLPGETFSMNDTIKERTKAHGYTTGFVVGPGGVFAEELGGGVSTATTATWTAAFFAGLERVHTQAHSIYISRYQPGLEATVAWGFFDMQFKNDTPDGVFIQAKTTNTSITVTMWGTRIYDEIEAEFGKKTNIRPYSTVYDDTGKCIGQEGSDGFTITVYRVFYQDGKEVKREPITTNYAPSPKVICGADPADEPVKPKKPSGSATATTSPSTSPSQSPTKKPSKSPTPEPTPEPTPSKTKKAA